jgi:hypothetical protein
MKTVREVSISHDARTVGDRLERGLRMALKSARQRVAPRALRQHVFVAGMQRSGTNMLMNLLEASHETQVFHETDPRAFDNYQMRDRAAIHALARACPAPVIVIKALCELDLLTDLMVEFEPAKTIWIVRDWRDSVASAVRSFGNFVPQWRRLARGTQSDWRGRGMSNATRSLIGELYRDGASEVDGAAIMWYCRNVLFFEQGLERDPRVRVVLYEELLRHPVERTRGLFDFLGLGDVPSRAAGRIRSSPTGRRANPAVASDIAELCDGLKSRFASLPKRTTTR